MVRRLVVPAEHIEQKLDFVMIGADLKFENDLFDDSEELVANSTFTAVATAWESIQKVSWSLLPLTQWGAEPLDHIKEKLIVSLETHRMV